METLWVPAVVLALALALVLVLVFAPVLALMLALVLVQMSFVAQFLRHFQLAYWTHSLYLHLPSPVLPLTPPRPLLIAPSRL